MLRQMGWTFLAACLATSVAFSEETDAGSSAFADPYAPYSQTIDRRGTFDGERVDYQTVLSETVLTDEDGKETAAIFSTAYLKTGVGDYTDRPISFFFNGGPGSSSVWLHMGAFGPKRVAIPSDARDDGAPPYPIVDNPHALLDVTDLVFIDPVGTGFSKALGDAEGKDFWGVHEDAAAIAQFIRLWISENGRWNSPKYLGGESYGTLRTAAVVRELEGGYNDVSLNGLILVSTVLDMYHDVTGQGNELAWPVLLPTMAATAWYHNALADRPDEIEPFLDEVRVFAEGAYMTALMKGNRLVPAERADVLARLSRYTGLSEDFLETANLRVSLPRFQKELLRSRGLTVGRLDSRYTGVDYDRAGSAPDQDPSFVAIDGAYTAALNTYFRSDLGLDIGREYEIISGLGRDWNWEIEGPGGGRFMFNVAPFIGTAMRHNSDLRVFNAAGYYDFATPFFSAEFSLTRNGLVPDRVVMKYYPAGHMMYVHEPSLEALNNDIRAFIEAR